MLPGLVVKHIIFYRTQLRVKGLLLLDAEKLKVTDAISQHSPRLFCRLLLSEIEFQTENTMKSWFVLTEHNSQCSKKYLTRMQRVCIFAHPSCVISTKTRGDRD